LDFPFFFLSSILNTAMDMHSLQSTPTLTMSEQIPVDEAFYYEVPAQSQTQSPASTVPLDETSSCETANIVITDSSDNDRVTRVPSRSLREVTKHDYAYRAYKEAMDAATAASTSSKSRRRKPGLGKRGREPTDVDSMLVRIQASLPDSRHELITVKRMNSPKRFDVGIKHG
jgi:hypothetical protein